MREIKFRAYDIEKKQFYYSTDGTWEMFGCLYMDWPSYFKIDQYTGLLDKTGKEIYEGDILEWPVSKERATVTYDKNYCAFRLINKFADCNVSIGLNIGDKGMATIIGNIHQNPELLEQSK